MNKNKNKNKKTMKRTKNLRLKRGYNVRNMTLNRGGVLGTTCGNEWTRASFPVDKYPHIIKAKNNFLRTHTKYTIEWETARENKTRRIVVKFGELNDFVNHINRLTSENKVLFGEEGKRIFRGDHKIKGIDGTMRIGTPANCQKRFKEINDLFDFVERKYKEDDKNFLGEDKTLYEVIFDHLFMLSGIKVDFINKPRPR